MPKSKWPATNLLVDTDGEIVAAASHIVPADLLSHQRSKVVDANAGDLPQRRLIEAIDRKYANDELDDGADGQQYPVGNGIVDDFGAIFGVAGICPGMSNGSPG